MNYWVGGGGGGGGGFSYSADIQFVHLMCGLTRHNSRSRDPISRAMDPGHR